MNNIHLLKVGYLALLITSVSYAMPGVQHDRGASLLRGTAVERGGISEMSMERLRSIGGWIDNPATKTGQYNLGSTGRPISPWNHNQIRHNPIRIARVFSGNGTVDPAALNVARLHKIQDMAVNSRPIDGWKITASRQTKANEILRFVERNGRLPKNLPTWVDKTGIETLKLSKNNISKVPVQGYVRNSVNGIQKIPPYLRKFPTTARTPLPFPRGPYPRPIPPVAASGLAVSVGASLTAGGLVFIFDTGAELISYNQGKISHGELKSGIKKAGIRAGAVGGATGVLYWCVSSPHGLVVVGVAVVAYVATDYAIAIWTDHWGTTPLELNELRGLLPDQMIDRTMLADLFLN